MKCVFFVRKKIFPRIRVRRFDTLQKLNRFSSGGLLPFIVFFAGFADEVLGVWADEVFVSERRPVV